MGTKNNPGEFDCYAAAAPDEPMFILLARDLNAPFLVEAWAMRREDAIFHGDRPDTPDERRKIAEARQCGAAMRTWRNEHHGQPEPWNSEDEIGPEVRKADTPSDFEHELRDLINRFSKENLSNTPDFVLAEFLTTCLSAFDVAQQQREQWYGRGSKPVETDDVENEESGQGSENSGFPHQG